MVAQQMQKVATIIVTFNRKELLAICLDAIEQQVYKPAVTYIIDNASTDETDVWVQTNGYDRKRSSIEFRYVGLPENIGGSGGFHAGLKTAFEAPDNFDAFWLMDDDGIPDAMQLEKLLMHIDERDYLSPMVIAKENPSKLSFGGSPNVADFVAKADNLGLVDNVAFPFNGVLYSRKLVEMVGYPVKELFIWGDEVNYQLRCLEKGFVPAVVTDAIHIHPADRQTPEIILRNLKVTIPAQDWKLYCYVRNRIYNLRTLTTLKHFVGDTCRLLFRYTIYFTFYSFDWRRLGIVCRAMWDGFRKDLSRLDNYR